MISSNRNQSTLNSSMISINAQGNSPINYNRIGPNNIFHENRIANNNYIEESKIPNINYANNNYNKSNNGALTNGNIHNIINRKRNYNQLIGIENNANLTSQNVKIIDVNEQNFKTPMNPKNEQYDFQVKKFK